MIQRLSIILTMMANLVWAQRKMGWQRQDPYNNTQFYIGIRGGAALTGAKILERFSSYISVDSSPVTYDKKYINYKKVNAISGVEFAFTYKSKFTLSFQPNYRRETFGYKFENIWTDTSGTYLKLDNNAQIRIDYISLPFIARFDFTKTALRPFILAGISYDIRSQSYKTLIIKAEDTQSGGFSSYQKEQISSSASNMFIHSSISWLAGIGCTYKVGNIRLITDLVYRSGMHNITNNNTRYDNDFSSNGDILDNLSLKQFQFSLGCLFPIKYLTNSYESVD